MVSNAPMVSNANDVKRSNIVSATQSPNLMGIDAYMQMYATIFGNNAQSPILAGAASDPLAPNQPDFTSAPPMISPPTVFNPSGVVDSGITGTVPDTTSINPNAVSTSGAPTLRSPNWFYNDGIASPIEPKSNAVIGAAPLPGSAPNPNATVSAQAIANFSAVQSQDLAWLMPQPNDSTDYTNIFAAMPTPAYDPLAGDPTSAWDGLGGVGNSGNALFNPLQQNAVDGWAGDSAALSGALFPSPYSL